MSQDQQQKIQHSLSRLALAKAIKTPGEEDLEAEPWNKSVIFNQPFIKELQKKKQLSSQLPTQQHGNKPHRRDKSNVPKPQIQTNNLRTKGPPSASIEKRTSELSITKKSSAAKISMTQQRASTYLPSDSEEEEEDDSKKDEEEESSDDSELLLPAVKKIQSRPVSYPLKVHPQSLESSSQDDVIHSPSTRGSSSSHTLPLTDEDDIELATPPLSKIPQQQQKAQPPKRQSAHVRSNSWIAPPSQQQEYHSNISNNRFQKQPLQQQQQYQTQQLPLPQVQAQMQTQLPRYSNNNRPLSAMSMDMVMDPMYYQRLQQQQQQYQQAMAIQQQQLQYQQALALQQQQQHYLLSRNPSAFFPPGSRVVEEPTINTPTTTTMAHHTYHNKRHSAAPTTAVGFNISSTSSSTKQQTGNKKSNKGMTNTDKRRRAEMKRLSTPPPPPPPPPTENNNNRIAVTTPTNLFIQENSPAMYFQQFNHTTTPPIMRNSHSNHSHMSRRTSYHF